MVKVTIPVNPIVTGETILAKIKGMADGKIHINSTVAIGAGLLIKCRDIIGVAVRTGERYSIRSNLVPGKGITSLIMGKIRGIHNRKSGIRSMVLCMAALAGFRGTLEQDAMHGSWFSDLLIDILMAVQTQIRHGLGRPKGWVALTAIFTNFVMGSHPTKGFTSLGIELTRCKHGIA